MPYKFQLASEEFNYSTDLYQLFNIDAGSIPTLTIRLVLVWILWCLTWSTCATYLVLVSGIADTQLLVDA